MILLRHAADDDAGADWHAPRPEEEVAPEEDDEEGEEEDYGNILDQPQVIDEASKTSQVKDKGWFEAIIELAKKPLDNLQKIFEGKQELQQQEFTQQLETQSLTLCF